jgi:hypothetical protein
MKKLLMLIAFVTILFCDRAAIFAQEEDDVPYLSDDDIAAIELAFPEDIPPDIAAESPKNTAPEGQQNEMSRLNTSQTIYHLLILDRTYCASNSDIGGIDNKLILYKYKHGKNGYLIALYKSPKEGSVFPLFPDRSRILVDLITSRKKTLTEFMDSSAFRVFVTSRRILSQMRNVLRKDL